MLTPGEKKDWQTKAYQSGLNVSDFVRRCVSRRIIPRPQPRVNLDTARELGKIGVNFNQQIRAMNTAIASGQHIPNVEESLSVVKEIYVLLRDIQGQLLDIDTEDEPVDDLDAMFRY